MQRPHAACNSLDEAEYIPMVTNTSEACPRLGATIHTEDNTAGVPTSDGCRQTVEATIVDLATLARVLLRRWPVVLVIAVLTVVTAMGCFPKYRPIVRIQGGGPPARTHFRHLQPILGNHPRTGIDRNRDGPRNERSRSRRHSSAIRYRTSPTLSALLKRPRFWVSMS